MRIAVDGMGGDHAPQEVVAGTIQAVNEYGVNVVITGPKEKIEAELAKYQFDKTKVEILDAREVISLDEAPVIALRRKKDSSLRRAFDLVREGKADAVVSAGSTGALLAGGLLIIGRIKGIDRAALAALIPGKNGRFMVIDLGANADVKPYNLVEFARMGRVYFESVLGFVKPKVGLINIGAEEEKGNELTKEAYQLLKADTTINFIGNVEPREVTDGDVQILVCDGFTGNTILKMYEGVVKNLMSMIKEAMMSTTRGKVGGLLVKPSLKEFMAKHDYKEEGGAALLGVDGLVIKAHGSSDARAYKNALRQAKKLYDRGFLKIYKENMAKEQ
ncbi:phosphate acyltransferase PlsX [Youngiibacter fragilis]|uniref:Phosphate acyltransferase n=1 Tax=Youngiibacter fragilis 232.1 TaxID=994573 RepID=V7IAZ2_9CLOT|nr:phosphate acyltransferase PlsX [Youngiibacter fragilis]ETA82022.1 phosphate acyltransferase [Youngiibacter fragilis 232.1]